MPEHQTLNFAGFEICSETHQLFYGGKNIPIESRQLKLLEILAAAYPEMVSKQELMDQLWPDSIVSDASLSRLISDTRKLLGTLGVNRDLITTVHRRGFCLNAEVQMATLDTHYPPASNEVKAEEPGVRLTNKCIWILSGIFIVLLGLVGFLVMDEQQTEQIAPSDFAGTWHIILQLKTHKSKTNSAGNPICRDRQLRYDVVVTKRGESYYLKQPQFTTELGPDLSIPVTKSLAYPDAGGYVTTEITLSFLSHNRLTGHSTWSWSLAQGTEPLCEGDTMFDGIK